MKYYKQMGFKLEEMQELLGGNTYYYVQQNFRSKIDELKAQEQEIHDSLVAVKDWYDLVREAQMVIRNDIRDISVKFMSQEFFCFMDQEFAYEYMDSIINIPWTNYLEEIGQKITGPVIRAVPLPGRENEGELRPGPHHAAGGAAGREESGTDRCGWRDGGQRLPHRQPRDH